MELAYRVKYYLTVILRKHGKAGFIRSVVKRGKILDVGCGNNSPFDTKQKRPDIHYTGLDIGEYNQLLGYEKYVDRLLLTNPENFHLEIEKYSNEFDAVISSHNLEHCNNPNEVLLALTKALKKDGKIYFAFPCEKSVTFPSRKGTLNFFDDLSHQNIVSFDNTINILKNNNIVIDFSARQYKPLVLSIIGLIFEPISRILNRQVPFGSTWAYYGFETIIIGHKV
jgi:SAM-dependent methyltransferase